MPGGSPLLRLSFVLLQSWQASEDVSRPELQLNRCGPVALFVAAGAVGCPAKLEDIEKAGPGNDQKWTFEDVQNVASSFGLKTAHRKFNKDPVPWARGETVAIARIFLSPNAPHYISLIESAESQVIVNDFPGPITAMSTEQLRNKYGWDGRLLFVSANTRFEERLNASAANRRLLMWATFLFAASAVLFWFRRPVRVVRRPSQQAGRSGYTIVELLVTLGIIAILLAVILPSVQRARDRAHVAQCASHLRQFGIAMAGFESAHQCFPNPDQLPGVAREIPQQKRPAFSPHVGLLSWLDLGSLESRIDYREASPDGDDPVTSSSNKTLVETLVPIFRCPSDAGVFPGNSYRACTGTSPALHTTPSLDAKIASLIGWHSGAKTSSSSVIDGLSHTVFFSERTLGDRDPARFTPYRDLALQASGTMLLPDDAVAACTLTISSKPGHLSFMGSNWLYDGTLETAYNHVLDPNSRVIDCTSWSSPILLPPGAVSARSLHPGGVNALLGDGSVRFFASQIDRQLWRALGSISGHEPTDEL